MMSEETSVWVMISLDLLMICYSLWVLSLKKSTSYLTLGIATGLGAWLIALHLGLSTKHLFPADIAGPVFLGVIVLFVGVVGTILLGTKPLRRLFLDLDQQQLLLLQGIRVFFGATFLMQASLGILPTAFGIVDGFTHISAGFLGLIAAFAFASGCEGNRRAWFANIFGLVDILIVASSLSLVLLPTITPHHSMMYAVFLPAPLWLWFHLISIWKLLRPQHNELGALPTNRTAHTAATRYDPTMKPLVLLSTGAAVLLFASACSLTGYPLVLKTVMKTVDPYFHGPGIDGTQFERITDKVYTFRWNWYRNLIVVTDAGLVVIDPMNAEMSSALRAELNQHFPGKNVDTLIYSHFHLDHTQGGSVLRPTNVLAHEKCPKYWKEFDHQQVLQPTRFISGDTVLSIGGVEIHALYLGLSHTDTLYAFHLPAERLVFTADLGLVRTVEPNGVPDRYAPGYLDAMNRVIALDFDTFVASHFGYGTKQDLIDWRDMLEEGRRLSREAVRQVGSVGAQQDQMGRYFDAVYYQMRVKYGHWHGFNDMFVLNLVRDIVGEALGY